MSESLTTDATLPLPLPLAMVVASGCLTAAVVSAFFVVTKESARRRSKAAEEAAAEAAERARAAMIDKEKYPGGAISVYYATQTGTAEAFAREIEREGPENGFLIKVVDTEDVEEVANFAKGGPDESSRAIILAATYGEGEPTDNATALVHAMKDAAEESKDNDDDRPLQSLDFCVFGLGNKQYDQYNAMGKFFDQHLELLGAKRIMPLGMGDDDDDLEADFESWKEKLWAQLKSKYHIESFHAAEKTDSQADSLPDCEYDIQYHQDRSVLDKQTPVDQARSSSKHYFTSFDCPVTKLKELRTPADGGSTVHMEIDISDHKKNGLDYHTADNFGVLPLNDDTIVESVASSLGYDLDSVFSLRAAPKHEWHGAPFPMPLTVRECLTRYLDLTSAPRRSDLKLLAAYAADPLDKKALNRMASKEGKKEYNEKITDEFVGMANLIKLCPSLSIPLEHLIGVCHPMQPRYYTISSSSSVHPDSVHLTVAVTEATRSDGSKFNGVASTHLASIKPASPQTVRVFNRPSTFRLPTDPSTPIIMIGPGTGVAPMRALLQERHHQRRMDKVGRNVLYFGCKKPTCDYLYRDEIAEFQSNGTLDELHVAFSRMQTEKVYVQHLLAKQGQSTYDLIEKEGAYVYVCGAVKMGHDVTEALKAILSTHGEMSFSDAKDYMAKLAANGRYVQELWA